MHDCRIQTANITLSLQQWKGESILKIVNWETIHDFLQKPSNLNQKENFQSGNESKNHVNQNLIMTEQSTPSASMGNYTWRVIDVLQSLTISRANDRFKIWQRTRGVLQRVAIFPLWWKMVSFQHETQIIHVYIILTFISRYSFDENPIRK